MSLKNVMCRKTREIIQIDDEIEKDYKAKYLHVSGKEFEMDEIEIIDIAVIENTEVEEKPKKKRGRKKKEAWKKEEK